MADQNLTATTAPSEHVVHRSTNLLYTLMHDCWRKGVEQFRNRLMVRVERDKSVSDAEYEATIARVGIALAGRQPIETAPKDGTPVLLWAKDLRFPGNTCVAQYITHDIEWWHVTDGKFGPWPLRGPSPTHWMPLPCGREEGGVTNG
jgi:hypothetical protein